MNELYLIGTVIFFLGVLMIVFRKALGTVFCRSGKSAFKASPYKNIMPVDSVFDESKGEEKFLFLGVINIIQSPLFFLLGWAMERIK